MGIALPLFFPPFRLDVGNEQLLRGTHTIGLRPKTFAVLRYLVEHPGRLVTKEEVLDAVWGQTVVSESVLKSCIRELRKALADAAQTPQYIETVHRRGYRFIAPLTTSPPMQNVKLKMQNAKAEPSPNPQPPIPGPVGRETELAQLHKWWERALRGERQIVFVTGEPGIGKTTVVEAFLAQIQEARGWRLETRSSSPQASSLKTQASSLWIGRGQCIEHYGAGEAYLPVLEALGRLCREPGGERLIELLSQHAPTWLVQMPALLSPAELEALQRKVLGATPERMLREMAEAVEALTAERGLVLRFEDLHWSDYSTLNLISYLARRQERARLLVIGTYRPVEVLGNGHPLRTVTQELRLHGHCAELPVRWLTEAAMAKYLTVRFGGGIRYSISLQDLAQVIHQHTEGNPLFMVNVVEHMVAQGSLVQIEGRWVLRGGVEEVAVGVPENLRQMIEKHFERLSPEEQRVLEVASVAGMEFSAATVAAGVEAAGDEIEERCAGLARRGQFLQVRGLAEWPDGTVATRYGFIHALYQEVVYQRVPAGRQVHLHRRIGEREEAAYSNRAGEIAAELAVHFERGRDYRRAVHCLQQAGENAARRHAYREAIDHLTRGIELLKVLPDTPERPQKELLLQTTLGPVLIATKGQAAPEVGKVYARAYELCQQEGESAQLFPILRGLRFFYLARGEFRIAYELSEQLLRLAQRLQDPALLLEAHHALGALLFWLGEFASAQKHFEQGLTLYDPPQHHTLAIRYGYDPGVACLLRMALVLWCLGYPDQALQRCHEALTLAQQEASHPLSSAYILHHAAWLHQFRREGLMTQERAEAVITVSSEQGFALYLAMGTILWGWALTEQGQREEGIAQMRRGLAAWRGIGNELLQPYYLALLAEAYGTVGKEGEALAVLDEALAMVSDKGERMWEAELYRLKGTLTLQSKVPSRKSQVEKETEGCFKKAIAIARQQSAKSLELRAVMSLSRLWQHQGKKAEARQTLAEIYGWFTEGFDTADLQEAKALLEELRN